MGFYSILTQELSHDYGPTPEPVPVPKSQGIPKWKPCEDGIKAEDGMKAEGTKKKKYSDDEWTRWQEQKAASKADHKAKPDEGQWKKPKHWSKGSWTAPAPAVLAVPVESEVAKPSQESMPSNSLLPEHPIWQTMDELRKKHEAWQEKVDNIQVQIKTVTEEKDKVNSEFNERLTQYRDLCKMSKDDVSKLSTFMHEQRDKFKLMDEQMSVAIAKDKEEAARRDDRDKAQHGLHRSRMDELRATVAEQDARIKELEARLPNPSESSKVSTPEAKKTKKK